MKDANSIPTRESLLARLKDWGDQESWREFFDTYWRLIHAASLKAGLVDAEAQEVVQEVMISAAKKMPEFHYEPGKDSLKGWLLAVTRWKVADQFRKRQKATLDRPSDIIPPLVGERRDVFRGESDDTPRTDTAQRVPDPNGFALEDVWEGEWRENLLRAALDRVKRRVNPAHYEMYHLHIVQGLPAKEAGRTLGVSPASVHLAKHRVGRLIRLELKALVARNSF